MSDAALCLFDSAKNDFLPADLRQALFGLFPNLVEIPTDRAWDKDPDFFQTLRPKILITGWGAPPLPESRSRMPELEYVCHLGGTVRGLVPRLLIEEGLVVTNWGSSHAETVAECALMLTLCCLRRVTDSQLTMHVEKKWKWPMTCQPLSLYRRRVGLHGFGAVARSLIPLLRPFGVSIQAWSHGVPTEVFAEAGVHRAKSLEDLFATSDVLIEVEAASPANRGSVRESHFRLLPPNAVFVNVGRAALVDEMALLKVAAEGWLQIGLDVYHLEPLPSDSPLRGLPNVCLLGHQAGPTVDRRRDAGEFALRNLRAHLAGEPLEGVVDLVSFDRAT